MSDEKTATIAVVLRGDTDTVRCWVETHPLAIEVLQISHHNEGIAILGHDELTQLRKGFGEAAWGTRRKVRRALQAQSHTKALEKSEEPSTTPSEAEGVAPKEAKHE